MLLIVQPGRPELISTVRAKFPSAVIVVDRRQGRDRRQPLTGRTSRSQRPRLTAERRRGPRARRAALTVPEESLWRMASYRIVYLQSAPP